MTDGPPPSADGPPAPDDPDAPAEPDTGRWAESAGHGAPPPPSWGTPAPPPGGPGEGEAEDPPATAPPPQATPAPHRSHDPYGTGSYGNKGADPTWAADPGRNAWAGRTWRRTSYTRTARARPVRTAVIFVVVVAGIVLIAAFGHHKRTSSGSATFDPGPLPAFQTDTVALGQAATVQADVSSDISTSTKLTYVPVTITALAVRPGAPDLPGSDDNTEVQFRACAGTSPIAPYLVASQLSVATGEDAAPVSAEIGDSQATSPDLSATIAPGQCVTGEQGFSVPAGQPVTEVRFGLIQTVTWQVP